MAQTRIMMARPCSFPLREDKVERSFAEMTEHHEEIRKNQKPTAKTFHATWYERSPSFVSLSCTASSSVSSTLRVYGIVAQGYILKSLPSLLAI